MLCMVIMNRDTACYGERTVAHRLACKAFDLSMPVQEHQVLDIARKARLSVLSVQLVQK